MTPEKFQDALCEEINNLLKDRRYKKPPPELEEELEDLEEEPGEDSEEPEEVEKPEPELVEMTVFPQNIPVPLSDDEDWNPVPYTIVRLNGGSDPNVYDSEYTISVVVILGIWDDGQDAQGHRELLNIINLIYERFKKNPCLDEQYIYKGEFKWDIQEDGYYPYYFGAINMKFTIPAIRREDPRT